MMEPLTEILSVDDNWVKGRTTRYASSGSIEAVTEWVRITDNAHRKSFWFLYSPNKVFDPIGIEISPENWSYIQKIHEEDWIDGANYVYDCCTFPFDLRHHSNEIAKLIINDVMAITKDFGDVGPRFIAPSFIINTLASVMFETKNVDRKHFSSILRRWLLGERDILLDPVYDKADTSLVDNFIAEVYDLNKDKFDGTDKVLNWLVGQVMKMAKGKADASYVKEKIREIHSGR